MSKKIFHRIVSLFAVLAVLCFQCGEIVCAAKVNGKDILPGTIKGDRLAKRTITSKRIANQGIRGKSIKNDSVSGIKLMDRTVAREKLVPVKNVVVVAKEGGDFEKVSEALSVIADNSETNPYLIKVAPGIYDDIFQMKEYVDIEGSGEKTTVITSAAGSVTVTAASNCQLRLLTVSAVNSGSNTTAIAASDVLGFKVLHVTVSVYGSGSEAVTGIDNVRSEVFLENVVVRTVNTANASTAISTSNTGSVTWVNNCIISAVSNGNNNRSTAVGVAGSGGSSVMVNNAYITVSAYEYARGIYLAFGSTHGHYISDSRIESSNNVSGTAGYGIDLYEASALISNTFSIGSSCGLVAAGSSSNMNYIDNCQLFGQYVYGAYVDQSATLYMGSTKVWGGMGNVASATGGTAKCTSCHDDSYISAGINTCP